MIRRPPRSTQSRSSAASDVYKRQRQAFVGLSDSYEQFYQAVRRSWRFGQKMPVDCYIITSDSEGSVVKNIQRKEENSQKMAAGMIKHMQVYEMENVRGSKRDITNYLPQDEMIIPEWLRSRT